MRNGIALLMNGYNVECNFLLKRKPLACGNFKKKKISFAKVQKVQIFRNK